jgi:hypothetical protein
MLAVALSCLLAAQDAAKVTLIVGGPGLEAKASDAAAFQPLAHGVGVPAGATLRTGAGVKAIFELSDGTELRVNEGTEFRFEEARKIDFKKGRLYARIAPGGPFVLKSEFAPITAESATLDLLFHPPIPGGPKSMTALHVFEGSAEVRVRRYGQKMTAGYQCTLVDAQLNTPDVISEGVLETHWVHALLRERGRATPEVEWRAKEMLQELSVQAKNDPYEWALRGLGELAVPVLADYLGRKADGARRAAAAKIVGEVATAKSAPLLVGLLGSADAETRVQAAKALSRAAANDLGYPESYWRGESRADGLRAWEAWAKERP